MKGEGDFFLVGGSPPTAPCMVLCKRLRFDRIMLFFTFAVGSFGWVWEKGTVAIACRWGLPRPRHSHTVAEIRQKAES